MSYKGSYGLPSTSSPFIFLLFLIFILLLLQPEALIPDGLLFALWKLPAS